MSLGLHPLVYHTMPKTHISPTLNLTLIPLGYFEDLSPLGGGGGEPPPPPPQISETNGPIDLKIGTVVKQVK